MFRPRQAARYRRPAPRVRVARWALLSILGLTFGWMALVNQLRVIGIGHVRAEEAILSSLFDGRLVALNVTCNQHVAKDQVVAVVSNPIRAAEYGQELADLEAAYKVRRAGLDARLAIVMAQLDAAAIRRDATRRRAANAETLAATVDQAWRRNESTLKDRVAANNDRDKARAALASAEAAFIRATAELERIRVETTAQLAGFAERLDAQRKRAALGGAEPILAPFDGVVTECRRNVGDVLRPSIAIIRIQRNDSGRIYVWVPAVELDRIRIGMDASVYLDESDRTVHGKVVRLPIEVGPLPDSLKRYFWQSQAWQQYAEIEIKPSERWSTAEMPGDARVDAVIELTDIFKLPLTLLKAL